MFALSVLDLPFESNSNTAPTTTASQEGSVLKLRSTPKDGAVIFHKDIKPAKIGEQPVGLVTTQAYFNPREKLNEDGSLKAIKDGEEFVAMQVWGCRMSVINTAGCPLPLVSVLLQIPEGAIPVGSEAFYTRNLDLNFDADETETIDYYFYFPAPGTFPHFPLHVSNAGDIIAHAPPHLLRVVERASSMDTSSWDSVSRLGSDAEVISFLRGASGLGKVRMEPVAARLMSKQNIQARVDFYSQVVNVFRERLVYNKYLWKFGFMLQDEQSIGDLLSTNHAFVDACGPYLKTRLLTTTTKPKYSEFAPYIHSRVHASDRTANKPGASQSNKGNNEKNLALPWQLSAPYRNLIEHLVYAPKPSRADLIQVCFMRIRAQCIDEARSIFASLKDRMDDEQETGDLKLQMDYLAAYFDLFGGNNTNNFEVARAISDRYKEYPVLHWRAMFAEIRAQLTKTAPVTAEDIASRLQAHGGVESVTQQGGGLHIAAAKLDLEIRENTLSIAWHPGKACTDEDKEVVIHYYAVDIEVTFSRDPFANENNIPAYLFCSKPTLSQAVRLPSGAMPSLATLSLAPGLPSSSGLPYAKLLEIPPHLVGSQLVIQVRDPASELECTRTYLGNSGLVAHALQQEGVLQIYEKLLVPAASADEQVSKKARSAASSPARPQELFKPLGGSYVKVFRKSKNGVVAFYKDGYTDVTGRFDYVACSAENSELENVQAFAILVLAPNKGAARLAVNPPVL